MNESTGKLILRITLGVLILLHGISKLSHGIDWLDGALASAGLPGFFKYGVYIGEVVAPLAVIAGYYSRIGAWLIAVNMLFALGLVHGSELFHNRPAVRRIRAGDAVPVLLLSDCTRPDRPGTLRHQPEMSAGEPLDNPVWHSLTTQHAGLAITADGAARYPAAVVPFAAIGEPTARAATS